MNSKHSPTAPAAPEPPPPGAAGQPSGNQRLVTFVNRMTQTIWVAAAPNANTPLAATGWVLSASVFTCSGVCDYRITFGLSH